MNRPHSTTLFSEVELPHNLLGLVLARVGAAKRRAARIRLALEGLLVFISGAVLVPAVSYAVSEFHTSGFYEYLSLFFSDTSVAFSNWQEISLSLVSSLPSLAILLLLAAGIAFAWSLLHATRNVRAAFGRAQFA